jgi:hypothetical protein
MEEQVFFKWNGIEITNQKVRSKKSLHLPKEINLVEIKRSLPEHLALIVWVFLFGSWAINVFTEGRIILGTILSGVAGLAWVLLLVGSWRVVVSKDMNKYTIASGLFKSKALEIQEAIGKAMIISKQEAPKSQNAPIY